MCRVTRPRATRAGPRRRCTRATRWRWRSRASPARASTSAPGASGRRIRRGRSPAASSARLLADALLVVHFLIAGFIVGGLILVWIGALAGWAWVRNRWFRYLHL